MAGADFLVIMLAMGLIYGLVIGFLVFNTFRWVQVKRSMFKKNYGIIYFTSRGKALFPKIVDFSQDVLRTHHGLWVLYEGGIYRQVTKEEAQSTQTKEIDVGTAEKKFWQRSHQKIKVKLHKEITPQDIQYRQGVPMMFLDIEDMIPLRLISEKMDLPITRNPYMIEAVLGKEVAAAELEALKITKKTIRNLILVVAVLVVISIAFTMLSWIDIQRIGQMTFNLTQMVSGITAPPLIP